MGLENQVALVTGAASDIGYAYVKCLLLNKVKVLLCDVNVDKCQAIAHQFLKEFQNINVFSTKCDVTNEDEFENAFKTCIKHFGRLDIVINNAGVFDNSIERRWSATVNINYGGVVRGTLLAIKYMGIPNGGSGGTVIQTSSLLVYSDSYHCSPMYLSTKKYLMEFTKSFGQKNHFSLHGVKIITLCPEFTANKCVSSAYKNEILHKKEERVEELEDIKNDQQSNKIQKSREMSHTVTVTRTTTSTTSAIILNTGYVKSVPGLLKLAEVILGGIVLGLLIYNRDNLCHCWVYGTHNAQLFFLGTVSAFFLTSLLLLISCLLSISTGPIISKTNFEFIYHGAGFVFLLLASVFLLLDANDNSGRNPQNHFVIASILGLIMAAFYLLSSIWGYRSYRGP